MINTEFELTCLNANEIENDSNWWQLYFDSFPVEELEPKEMIINAIHNNEAFALAAKINKVTVGLALIYIATTPPNIFLDYLAVSNEYRNREIGTKLFFYSFEIGLNKLKEKKLTPIGMFWEIADPGSTKSPEQKKIREKRQEFFSKLGGKIVPINYLQPPVHPGSDVIKMLLMVFTQIPDEKFSKEILVNLIYSIYFDGYEEIEGLPKEEIEKAYKTVIDSIE